MQYNKIKGLIKEKYGTQECFSKAMSINNSTLSQKLNGKSDFSASEMQKIVELLEIPVYNISDYFFCAESSESRTFEEATPNASESTY